MSKFKTTNTYTIPSFYIKSYRIFLLNFLYFLVQLHLKEQILFYHLIDKYNKSETTTNYEISTTIKDVKESFPKIKRITAAVVVDGHYKVNKDGKKEFVPLSEVELKNIENLVKKCDRV